MPVLVQQIGAEAVSKFFRDATKVAQANAAKDMRRAGNLFARDIRTRLASGSPLKSGTGRERKNLVRLFRGVRVKVRKTAGDVIGIVGYSRRSFYGRFHETGINKMVARRRFVKGLFGRKAVRGEAHQWTLPQRPIIEPIFVLRHEEAERILGSSYDVLFRGRS